jgi:hypothetical protein
MRASYFILVPKHNGDSIAHRVGGGQIVRDVEHTHAHLVPELFERAKAYAILHRIVLVPL